MFTLTLLCLIAQAPEKVEFDIRGDRVNPRRFLLSKPGMIAIGWCDGWTYCPETPELHRALATLKPTSHIWHYHLELQGICVRRSHSLRHTNCTIEMITLHKPGEEPKTLYESIAHKRAFDLELTAELHKHSMRQSARSGDMERATKKLTPVSKRRDSAKSGDLERLAEEKRKLEKIEKGVTKK